MSTTIIYRESLSATRNSRNEYRDTVIRLAAIIDHPEVITCLVDSVTSEQRFQLLRMQTISGSTALHYAALSGHTELITSILDCRITSTDTTT